MPRHAGTRGVMVTNTPDVLTEEVADTAIGLLINTVRELSAGGSLSARRALGSRRSLSADPWQPCAAVAPGFSAWAGSGMAIARRLEAFGLPVAYHNRRPVEGVGL